MVGKEHVLTDPQLRAGYERDWTGRFGSDALAVVRPGTVEQVAAVVALCAREGVAIVPQGGNTGLVGGSVPRGGEVVLSLRRLRELGPVDATAGQVEVGAGVTLHELQEHARAAGMEFGMDMASRGSATVGGMIATNAGGSQVMRYGSMCDQVLGVEAVLGSGQVIQRLSGLPKDNAGYDLVGLLAGSEGTLGVVTRARLRVVPRPRYRAVALLGFASVEGALEALAATRAAISSLLSADVFFREGMELVCAHLGSERPFTAAAQAYLLLEAASTHDVAPDLFHVLDRVPGVLGSAAATEPRDRQRLWAYRERHTEAINAAGIPHKLDIAVPPGAVAAFERELRALLAAEAPEARLFLFGHLAEGNFHVNIIGLPPEDERVDGLVLELVARHGGTISSEHGVGIAKARWLPLVRSEADIAAMAAVKRALDPALVLNPGVILGPLDRPA
ncbi:MAG: FAD-binding oxidoreductase [Dehalococcoidia bacterium]|nr:FAD-binding oxidoreductase [Dehalococcoidia bacterium]